jgi:hypothetical protein
MYCIYVSYSLALSHFELHHDKIIMICSLGLPVCDGRVVQVARLAFISQLIHKHKGAVYATCGKQMLLTSCYFLMDACFIKYKNVIQYSVANKSAIWLQPRLTSHWLVYV